MKKLMADTICGIVEVEEFDAEETTEQIFVACLDDLPDGEIICAEVSDITYDIIKERYGIKKA